MWLTLSEQKLEIHPVQRQIDHSSSRTAYSEQIVEKLYKDAICLRMFLASATELASHFEPDFSPSSYLSSRYERWLTVKATLGRERKRAQPSSNCSLIDVADETTVLLTDRFGTCLWLSLSNPSLYMTMALSSSRNDGIRVLCRPRRRCAWSLSSRRNCITQWFSGQSKVTNSEDAGVTTLSSTSIASSSFNVSSLSSSSAVWPECKKNRLTFASKEKGMWICLVLESRSARCCYRGEHQYESD